MSVEPSFRRVLLALDAATHGAARLEQAVALAARLRAEIVGVFVEDLDLLRSAALPIVRRVNLTTGAEEDFDVAGIERELRAIAGTMRTKLELAAARAQVSWSFRAVRSALADELRSAIADVDVLVLSAHTRAPADRVASTELAGPLLGLPATSNVFERVVTLFRGTAECEAALRLALRIGRGGATSVKVVLPASSSTQLERLAAQVADIARTIEGSQCEAIAVTPHEERSCLERIADEDSLLVLGAGERRLADRIGLSFVRVERVSP